MPGRFVVNVLLGAALLLAGAGAVNYVVDPFQQYRIPRFYAPRFYPVFQRFENPGLARHYDFDRAIIGSSMTENLAASEVDAILGGRSLNLSLSAMTAYDALRLLEVVLARGNVRQVLYNLDFNAFAGAVDRTGFPDPLPTYLYDDRLWNDYPYLLSFATLKKSLEIVTDQRVNRFSTDRDRPWYWADGIEFSARRAVEGLEPHDLNRQFPQPRRTLEGMLASFERNVVALVRANPDVEFVFTYPPYSVLAWADLRQRGELELTLAFKKRVFEELALMPNVRMFDFQGERAIIEDLDRYKDIYHFTPAIGRWTIEAIATGRDQVSAQNLVPGLDAQRRIAEEADPAKLIASARRS